jgi:hypothetical protein
MTATRVKITYWLERDQREALKRAVEKNTMKPGRGRDRRNGQVLWIAG